MFIATRTKTGKDIQADTQVAIVSFLKRISSEFDLDLKFIYCGEFSIEFYHVCLLLLLFVDVAELFARKSCQIFLVLDRYHRTGNEIVLTIHYGCQFYSTG